jgi:hypothetical protein
MVADKQRWQDTSRWIRVGVLSLSALSPLINIVAARLRANIEAQEAIVKQHKAELENRILATQEDLRTDWQERLQAVGATLGDTLAEMRANQYSQELLKRGEELKERSSKLSQALVERGGQVSQELAERGSKFTHDVSDLSNELSHEIARRGRKAGKELAEQDRNVWIVLGFSSGLLITSLLTFWFVRRRLQKSTAEEPPIQLSYNDVAEISPANQSRGGIYSIGANGTRLEAHNTGKTATAVADELQTQTPSEVASPEATTAKNRVPADAAFVGITSTKRYYPVETPLDQFVSNDGNPVDVIYFASTDEARVQGFSAGE